MDQFGEFANSFKIKCLNIPHQYDFQREHDPVEVFMQFPKLTKWEFSDGEWQNDDVKKSLRSSTPARELDKNEYSKEISSMVQRWLFFEFLHAFFHEDGSSFRYEDYIKHRDGGHYICTKHLRQALRDWKNALNKRSDGLFARDRNRRIIQAHDVLIKARSEVAENCAVLDGSLASLWPVDPAVTLSIIALGETLTSHVLGLDLSHPTDIAQVGWRREILATQG